MASTSTHLHHLLLLLLSISAVHSVDLPNKRKIYIVHVDPNHPKPSVFPTQNDWYSSQLSSASSDAGYPSPPPLLYTYSAALHGFSALLTPSQAHSLLSSSSVVDVYEDPLYTLHTTRTPHFLGLPDDDSVGSPVSADSAALGDVIIGVLDTGVWPESKSFDDAGMPPVPSRWRGECEPSADFKRSLCNRKLIGARSFSRGFRAAMGGDGEDPPRSGGSRRESVSPRDTDGHGTHTASTTAGARVANASLFGYAKGTARGIAGRARVAAYKVCWASGCYGSDILAAMESAISDGVDVLSLSLGGGGSSPFFRDTIAVGAFSAVSRGIFVSCSAGNSGPSSSTVANAAPWIATVGAGTLDRDFPSYAVLGDGKKYTGVSLYSGRGMGSKMVPLIYGNGNNSSGLCLPGTLDPAKVRGKVVFCDRGINARVEKGALVKAAGGVGMILANTAANGEELVADSHLLPAVAVGKKTGDLIRNYLRNNRNSMAVLSFGGTVLGVRPSPVVAAFSSRGPSQVVPGILKPDVIGPGVNILAAWSGSAGPTGLANDTRRTGFNIMSGTSMSCPHISGVAALLKAAHPDWSPSAIKSAMMTTAYTVDNTGSPLKDAAGGGVANPFAYGAGHVNPQKALAPGLVYDAGAQDYIAFLCSLDYTVSQVRAITRQPNATCTKRFSDPGQLNYPSFSVSFSGSRRVVKYVREVTNVGPAAGRVVYDVSVSKTSNVSVTVRPARLVFKRVGEKQRYTAWFRSNKAKTDGSPMTEEVAFGWIAWSNKQHQVRSPVVYTWKSY